MKKFWLIILFIIIFLFLIFLPRQKPTSPLVTESILHLEKSYSYGAIGPDSFDCSGFVYYCVKQAYDIIIPRTAYEQGYNNNYEKIEDIKNLKKGDLLYFNTIRSDKDLSDHTGIYIGNNEFIHCSSAIGKVVISKIENNYYSRRFSWGRRLINYD